MKYEVKRLSDYIVELTIDGINAPNWSQRFFWQSDQHWDSKKARRDMIKRHLDEAVECDAPIFFFGDWYDVMQGKDDRRGSKSDVRKEFQSQTYFDDIVGEGAEWLKPYAANIAGWAMGNHETAVMIHHETNLVQRTIDLLRYQTGEHIEPMGYEGYILLNCRTSEGKGVSNGKIKVFYNHGSGGGGQVTKGVNKTLQISAKHPDADIIIQGHTHKFWCVPEPRVRVTSQGRQYTDTQWHLQLSTYKDPFHDPSGLGWEIEKGFGPVTPGAFWTTLKRRPCPGRIELAVIPELAL